MELGELQKIMKGKRRYEKNPGQTFPLRPPRTWRIGPTTVSTYIRWNNKGWAELFDHDLASGVTWGQERIGQWTSKGFGVAKRANVST